MLMANALKFQAVVLGKTLALPDLGAFEGKRVEVIVVEDEAAPPPPIPFPGTRPLGLLRGELVVPDDFDDPLPADIQKFFDGDGDEPWSCSWTRISGCGCSAHPSD
jgi:hypothetical protein